VDETYKQLEQSYSRGEGDSDVRINNPSTISRRDWFKAGLGGSVGLALGGLIDVATVRAETKNLKLSNVSEFTTSCNFCSCGCGMIAAVRDGKLIAMEGDYDHIVNRGSLCVKGISMFATHASPQRLTTPLYRAPGSNHWEELSWKDAAERVARKIKKTRDENWVATEKLGDRDVPVNRTDAIAFLGGAQNTNEECYLFQKAARLLGMPFVEHQARL
jgi:formate dehydrogenase major subunit